MSNSDIDMYDDVMESDLETTGGTTKGTPEQNTLLKTGLTTESNAMSFVNEDDESDDDLYDKAGASPASKKMEDDDALPHNTSDGKIK